jgi:prepilin peptidase CpaA
MNLIATAPVWLLIIIALLLAAAAIEDAARLRISNVTCAGIILSALAGMAIAGFSTDLWQNAVNFIVLLVIGTAAFATGKIGGGDVKLLAGLGLWFNLSGAVWLIAAVFLAGGICAVLFILFRLFTSRKVGKGKAGGMIPYGLAIVAGAVLVFGAQLGVGQPDRPKADPLTIRPLS